MPWIVLTPPGGDGTGAVNFTVQATTSSERSGTISVGGLDGRRHTGVGLRGTW